MKNEGEHNMENEMETRGTWGFTELNLSYYIGESIFITMHTHNYKSLISHGKMEAAKS